MESERNVPDAQTFSDGAEEALRHVRAIAEEAGALGEAVGGMARSVQQKIDLESRLRANPAGTLLMAAGVGYVMGGGFFSPFTGRVLRYGARLWLLPALKRQLMRQQAAATEDETDGEEYH